MSYLFFSSLIRYYRERSAAMYAKLIRTNGFTVAGFRNDRAKFKLDILRTVINSVRHFKKTAVHGKSDEKKARKYRIYHIAIRSTTPRNLRSLSRPNARARTIPRKSRKFSSIFTCIYTRYACERERESKKIKSHGRERPHARVTHFTGLFALIAAPRMHIFKGCHVKCQARPFEYI